MKKIMLLLLMILLLTNLGSSKLESSSATTIDANESTITESAIFQIDDLGDEPFLLANYVEFRLNMDALPYNYSNTTYIDACNYTTFYTHNILDSSLKIINTTVEIYQINYTSGDTLEYDNHHERMYDVDSFAYEFKCHIVNFNASVINNLPQSVNNIQTNFPARTCKGCNQTTDILANSTTIDSIIDEKLKVYTTIQFFLDMEYLVINIIMWIIKITVIFIALALVLSIIYYIYKILVKWKDRI